MCFSWLPRKVPKEGDAREHSEKANKHNRVIATGNYCYFKFAARSITPEETPARITIRHPKMFRFSGVYKEKTCKPLSGRCSKIGPFLDTGW